MTFDPERYRAELAPLKLTKEKEDELLIDLWKIIENLVDQSLSSPFYPLHMAIAQHSLDSLEEAFQVKSEDVIEPEESIQQNANAEEKEIV